MHDSRRYRDNAAEVTEIVGIDPATVKTRMFYARKKLADFVASATGFGAGDSPRECRVSLLRGVHLVLGRIL
jgi:hypothetical protein